MKQRTLKGGLIGTIAAIIILLVFVGSLSSDTTMYVVGYSIAFLFATIDYYVDRRGDDNAPS